MIKLASETRPMFFFHVAFSFFGKNCKPGTSAVCGIGIVRRVEDLTSLKFYSFLQSALGSDLQECKVALQNLLTRRPEHIHKLPTA